MDINEALRERTLEYLEQAKISKAELSAMIDIHRTSVVQYLNDKRDNLTQGTVNKIEEKLAELVRGNGKKNASTVKKIVQEQHVLCQTHDAAGVMAVCQSCQDYMGLGVVVGRSGYGKSYSLKYYAKGAKVAYVECNESMNARDLVKAIERVLSLPHVSGTIDDRLDNIKDFFNANSGWLLIIDEADKLITKYTQKKAEILRSIYDQSDMGLVLAGEPALDKIIRQYIPRMANRIDFRFALSGLSTDEVKKYICDISVDASAEKELIRRACNDKNGCFRLLDRTYRNIVRLADGDAVTLDIVKAASAMMMI
jgi:DNA transposition AAA+ family ATPase|nr:MAG TPA: putative ATPase [Caudoviricetes sp.]